ncbi:copper amine oxidase [Paenibacillus rhizovicinus]|uniref:Copper amine oxidase n=1 Tax=Paenibacillus rhizovicinus TaxID=2704463 RepID=A0A6C0P2I2_9BACL|nr:stalk domain-containing protein [Paenibacillus rhizovicinus]QHW30872.1 copper amine oxidase [Paenibacillus rhizovicinus]
MLRTFKKSKSRTAALTAVLLLATIGTGAAYAEGLGPIAKPASSPLASEATVRTYSAAPAAPKAAATGEPLHIVAVGDSLTVGYENGMQLTSVPYGYVDRVYEQALYHGRADVKNYGIMALRTPGLNNFLKAAANGTSVTPEEIQPNLAKDSIDPSAYTFNAEIIGKSAALADDLKKADLVTLTIGGNDFTPIFDDIRTTGITDAELQTKLDTMLADYVPQLESSLRSILALNPKTTIVFADQYLPAPAPSILNKAITKSQYDILTGGVTKLKGLDETLAAKLTQEGYDVRTVDVSTPFKGNELTYTYILKGDIHPKQSGYDVMGRAFAQGIWGDYRDPAALAAGAPLRVIVNGTDLKGSNPPVLKNNTTFLPMRDVANALHATLNWDNKTRTATIASGGKKVAFTMGAKSMVVNGQTVPLETPAYLQQSGGNSLTYLPLAALSKGLGYQVDYRKPILTVFINS